MYDAEPRARLLLVEDDPFIQRLIDHILHERYVLTLAPSLEEALAAATRETFDLILIDINLRHRTSGLELLHTLRQMPAYAEAPILTCTAFVEPHHRALFRAAGFDAQIDKPFTREALLTAVEGALAQRVAA